MGRGKLNVQSMDLGERAGNASLEEIVMAVRTRKDVFPCDSNIDATHIVPTSRVLFLGLRAFPYSLIKRLWVRMHLHMSLVFIRMVC